MRVSPATHAQMQVNRCSWNIVNTMIMIVSSFMSGSLAFKNIMHDMRDGITSLWQLCKMNRETLLNKNFSPPLGRLGTTSNGIPYSNTAVLSASQSVNEASWIPSYRGSNSVKYFVKFKLEQIQHIYLKHNISCLKPTFIILFLFSLRFHQDLKVW